MNKHPEDVLGLTESELNTAVAEEIMDYPAPEWLAFSKD